MQMARQPPNNLDCTANPGAEAHLTRRPPRSSDLSSVPAAMDEVVLTCLAKVPGGRYEDAAEVEAAHAARLM
jgi:hypothetical protein